MNNLLFILHFCAIGYFGASIYEYLARKIGKKIFNKESLVLFGYKLHHSLYGLLGLLFSLMLFINGKIMFSEILLGLSFGTIVQHTVTDGFRFLSKE